MNKQGNYTCIRSQYLGDWFVDLMHETKHDSRQAVCINSKTHETRCIDFDSSLNVIEVKNDNQIALGRIRFGFEGSPFKLLDGDTELFSKTYPNTVDFRALELFEMDVAEFVLTRE